MSWSAKKYGLLAVLLSTANLYAAPPPPTLTKSFSPASVNVLGESNLTFTLTNTTSNSTLTGVAFTDVLPPGVVTPNNTIAVCGGTLTTVLPANVTATSSGTVTLTGVTLANPGAPCMFTIATIGVGAGAKNNVTSNVTSNEAPAGPGASATLQVVGPPVISKSFTPAQVLVNQTSTLAFSIQNPNAVQGLTGVGFTDTLPNNVVIATPNGFTGSCGGGTISATAGGTTVSLTGASLSGGAACNFSVKVTSSIASVYPNVVLGATSNEEGSGGPAIATLTVIGPPSIKKTFSTALLALGKVATLSLTVTNPNPTVGLTGVGFTDTLPFGLLIPPTSLAVCGGTLTITNTNNISTVTLSGAALTPPSANVCPIAVAVIGISPGAVTNTTSIVTSNEAGNGPASSASITVVSPPVITKSFSLLAIPVGSSTSLTLIVQNTNVTVPLTGVGFTDVLPAGLVVATPNGLTAEFGTCGAGTITATAGTNTISLNNSTIAMQSFCAFAVNVTAVSEGVQNNTTTAVTSVEGGSGNMATATIATGSAFQVHTATNLTAGDDTLRFTNSGVDSTVPTPNQDGNICINIYEFTPDSTLVACCTCPLKPDGLLTLSATTGLVPRPFVGNTTIIKAVSSLTNTCNPQTVGQPGNPLAPGMLTWATNAELGPGSVVMPQRTTFRPSSLSGAELGNITTYCSVLGGTVCTGCGGALR